MTYLFLETNFHHGETKLINLGECEGSDDLALEKAEQLKHIGFDVFSTVVEINDEGTLRHVSKDSIIHSLLPVEWGLYISSDGIEEGHF
jgi:hypothetical protein